MTERTRFTIAVEPHVYEAFADLAHSSGVSLSRCIGDWLRDTAEAAQMTTVRVNEVRKSHQDIAREFLSSQGREVERIMRGEGVAVWGPSQVRVHPNAKIVEPPAGRSRGGPAPRGGSASAGVPPPRPVIRGGKSPAKGSKS